MQVIDLIVKSSASGLLAQAVFLWTTEFRAKINFVEVNSRNFSLKLCLWRMKEIGDFLKPVLNRGKQLIFRFVCLLLSPFTNAEKVQEDRLRINCFKFYFHGAGQRDMLHFRADT